MRADIEEGRLPVLHRVLISCVAIALLAPTARSDLLVSEDWSGYDSQLSGDAVGAGRGLTGTWTTTSSGIESQNGPLQYTWDDPAPTVFSSRYVRPKNSFSHPTLSASIDNLVDGGAITGRDVAFSYIFAHEGVLFEGGDSGVWLELGGLDYGVYADKSSTTVELRGGVPGTDSVTVSPFSANLTTYRITGELTWDAGAGEYASSIWLNQSFDHPGTPALAQLLDVDISAEDLTQIDTLQFRWEGRSVEGGGFINEGNRLGVVTFEEVSAVIPEPSAFSFLLAGAFAVRCRRRKTRGRDSNAPCARRE